MTFIIGLTGGIGSGKSTVASTFASLGVTVISADAISHQLTTKGERAYLEICKQFGANILLQNGDLDRAKLGDLIFNDNALKTRLEGILHPLIVQTMRLKVDATQAPYIVLDIPLLIGTPEQIWVDRILVVDCEMKKRIERIKKRNSWSSKKVEAVMSAQPSEHTLLEAADDVIDNNGSFSEISEQVAKLHKNYLIVTSS